MTADLRRALYAVIDRLQAGGTALPPDVMRFRAEGFHTPGGHGHNQQNHAGGGAAGGAYTESDIRGMVDAAGGSHLGVELVDSLGVVETGGEVGVVLGMYDSNARSIRVSRAGLELSGVDIRGVIAHEVMHDRFRNPADALKLSIETAKANNMPVDKFINGMTKDAPEISDYSAFHWKQVRSFNGPAATETLCEIHRVITTGETSIDELPFSWAAVYQASLPGMGK